MLRAHAVLVLAGLLLGGCITRDVLIAPFRVAEVASTLRHNGSAVVSDMGDRRLRIDAREEDGTRGRSLRALVRRCPDRPASPYRPNERGCRFARERAPVRLARVDPWANVALWSGAFVVTVVAGTLLGVSGALDDDE